MMALSKFFPIKVLKFKMNMQLEKNFFEAIKYTFDKIFKKLKVIKVTTETFKWLLC